MKCVNWHRGILLSLASGMVAIILGCGQADRQEAKPSAEKATQTAAATGKNAPVHDHSGWWCDEHGVPEDVCGQCNAKLAAEFKKKGDWCSDHDRPKSQCFKCDPKLREKFAAQYRAKYGKEPPAIEDDEKKEGKSKAG